MTDNGALNQLLELVFVVVSATVGIIFLFVYQSLFGVVLACIVYYLQFLQPLLI